MENPAIRLKGNPFKSRTHLTSPPPRDGAGDDGADILKLYYVSLKRSLLPPDRFTTRRSERAAPPPAPPRRDKTDDLAAAVPRRRVHVYYKRDIGEPV
ncbi:hypothetical protein EVAR_15650_1 [Eumeta japonica]|uniref:Uncharacterized protein n=1 Tax=Eumeta variegata TaxID=151549 RepID=A0A4C1UAQ2_EUMVA|nr:hypothetical protein EVAR_15650_1 [Eumeta japonica]